MNKQLLLLTLSVLILSFSACKKTAGTDSVPTDLKGNKAAPDGFDYSTTKKIDLNVRLLFPDDKPVKRVLVSVYNPNNVNKGAELTKIMSDDNGNIQTSIIVPSSLDTVIIDPAFVGLMSYVKAYATNNVVNAIIGGKSGNSGNVVIERSFAPSAAYSWSSKNLMSVRTLSVANGPTPPSTYYDYDKTNFDALGRPLPSKLYAKDNIDWDGLLTLINAALPEQKKVNQDYIKTEAPANLKITKLADVWITFVHEGADYRNSFGYYTYPTGNPPVSAADIDTIHMIFPNASLLGHAGQGNMLQGDKVKIGRFPAGTTIGFILLQNAYKTDQSVTTTGTKFYTNETFNPEEASIKRHNVLLHNAAHGSFLIGFEDIERTAGKGSDQDFNDLVVYAQSNPVDAISPTDIPYLEDNVPDDDGDGVPDDRDEYPHDPDRAYNRYYPSESIWGTTAFEDLWPDEGDYDLNDLVISYRYKFAMSAGNMVADLTGEYQPLAAGALQQNGFGVQLPINPSAIASVSGYSLSGGTYISLASNGVEAGQPKAVVIPFDNYRNLFGSTASYVNTNNGAAKLNAQKVTLAMQFTTPLAESFTAQAPFNPFMISNLDRGREVHLVDKEPTALAKQSLFGTIADASNPLAGKYYLTSANKPFAIDIYGPFKYPIERTNITDAYLHYKEWALSDGKSFTDWYSNTATGYRNEGLLYKK